MTINKLYFDKTTSKNGKIIPSLQDGKTLESKYNPENEALKLVNSITENYSFFVVFGISSGTFVSILSKKFPDAIILAVENTQEDLDFISDIPDFEDIKNNQNIILSTIKEFKNKLIQYYVPSLYGNLKIIEMFAWVNINSEIMPFIKNELSQALEQITADFSVQAHFGKVWNNNILNNIKYLNSTLGKFYTDKKTACVIAAGPSLDKQIDYLKENIDDYFIISTDTAYQSLLKNQINPEIVVSIDGQFISHHHFFDSTTSDTIFAFDLCANNSAVQYLCENKLLFFVTGHPLSNSINSYLNDKLLKLESGSGTVTIAAVDLAIHLNFKNIQLIGADFGYLDGKPYCKGTYLDHLYNQNTSKLTNSETLFSKLMFRTELIDINSIKKTTTVLDSYRISFEDFLQSKKLQFNFENDIYFIQNNNSTKINISKISSTPSEIFDYLKHLYSENNYSFLLPFVAHLRTQYPSKSFEELLKLAYSSFVRYN